MNCFFEAIMNEWHAVRGLIRVSSCPAPCSQVIGDIGFAVEIDGRSDLKIFLDALSDKGLSVLYHPRRL